MWFIKCFFTECQWDIQSTGLSPLISVFSSCLPPSGCNLVFQKFNTHFVLVFFQTIISLTFLCIVRETWKNIGGVQEKLSSESSPEADKSLVVCLFSRNAAFCSIFSVEHNLFFFSTSRSYMIKIITLPDLINGDAFIEKMADVLNFYYC